MHIRKTVIIKETIEADGVGEACDPITRVVAVAVIQNPFAGRFVEPRSGGYSAAARDLAMRNGESASARRDCWSSVSGRTGLRQGPTGRPEWFVACFTAAL